MSDSIQVSGPHGTATFRASEVTIGRQAGCDVLITEQYAFVSREHAKLTRSPTGWAIVDEQSRYGTWIGDRRVVHEMIVQPTSVRLGPEEGGVVLRIEPSGVAHGSGSSSTPANMTVPVGGYLPTNAGGAAPPPVNQPVNQQNQTVVIQGGKPGRGGQGAGTPSSTKDSADTITLSFGGRTETFSPGRTVTLGRSPDCSLSTTNPTVSRMHAEVTFQGDHWKLRDTDSAGGVWLDGRRRAEVVLEGNVSMVLGPAEAGERLVVMAKGVYQRSRGDRMRAGVRNPIAIALVVAVVVAGLAFAVLGSRDNGSGGAASGPSAVLEITLGERKGYAIVIDKEAGLLLTTASLVAPDADGQALRRDVPPGLLGDFARSAGKATVEFPGEDAVSVDADDLYVDGYRDVAIIRTTIPDGALDDIDELAVADVTSGIPIALLDGERRDTALNTMDSIPDSVDDAVATVYPNINAKPGAPLLNEDDELIGLVVSAPPGPPDRGVKRTGLRGNGTTVGRVDPALASLVAAAKAPAGDTGADFEKVDLEADASTALELTATQAAEEGDDRLATGCDPGPTAVPERSAAVKVCIRPESGFSRWLLVTLSPARSDEIIAQWAARPSDGIDGPDALKILLVPRRDLNGCYELRAYVGGRYEPARWNVGDDERDFATIGIGASC